jgi:hypothetical protein
MLSLVYASSASRQVDEQDLMQLITAARKHNEANQITGLLLYKDGNFMQAIEGPDDAVEKLFDHVRRDGRHHGVLQLLKEHIEERRFPKWSMALQHVDKLSPEHRALIDPFLKDSLTAESYKTNPTAAIKLLLTFRDVVR